MQPFHEKLLNGAASYHDGSADERAYVDYLQRMPSINSEFGDFIIGFLIDWGSMARTFPREGLGGLKERLDEWFTGNQGTISSLSKFSLWEADLRELGLDICELFDSLRRIRQPFIRGRKRAFGSTAAGKTLHLLIPNLCVIWDEKTIRKNIGLDQDAWSYLRYLAAEKQILEKAIHDASRQTQFTAEGAVRWIERTHRVQRDNITPLSFDEPVTKILDEAMYNPDFAHHEVKPLLQAELLLRR